MQNGPKWRIFERISEQCYGMCATFDDCVRYRMGLMQKDTVDRMAALFEIPMEDLLDGYMDRGKRFKNIASETV